jgi:hypothetical protein
MLSQARPSLSRERSVFINCPFDSDYRPLFRAACFTLMSCGYQPRCALDFSDSGIIRFTEIVTMIAACDRSIHDISRVELDQQSSLPRFNMPLELVPISASALQGRNCSDAERPWFSTRSRTGTTPHYRIFRAWTSKPMLVTSVRLSA